MNSSTHTERVPSIVMRSMTWVEPDPPRAGVAYATDGEWIYERRLQSDKSHIYRRAHWNAVAMVVAWEQLPGFLWEQLSTDADPIPPPPKTERSR